MGKISVGPPYFNLVFLIPTLPLLALLGVGMHSAWKKGKLDEKKRPLLVMLGVAAVLGVADPGRWPTAASTSMSVGRPRRRGFWVILSVAVRARAAPAQQAGADARPARHDASRTSASACSRSASPSRRAIASRRTSRCGRARASSCRATRSTSTARSRSQGPNYDAVQAEVAITRGDETRRDAAPAEARLPRAAQPDDRGRHRGRLEPRPVRRDGRGPRRRRLEHARCSTSRWCASSGWARWSWASGGFIAITDRRYRTRARQTACRRAPSAAGGSRAKADLNASRDRHERTALEVRPAVRAVRAARRRSCSSACIAIRRTCRRR